MRVRAINFDRHTKRFAKQAHRLQAFLIVRATATDEDSDLKGVIDELTSVNIGAGGTKITLWAMSGTLYSLGAPMMPLNVVATFVKLAIPPPMMRVLPSG